MPLIALHQRDSRRLTGPSRFWDLPSAILDVGEPGAGEDVLVHRCTTELLVATWERQARRLLEAVGWSDQRLLARVFDDGASLLLSAPLDALYAATEVNEAAFVCACAEITRRPPPDLDELAGLLRVTIADEANPALPALAGEARRRGLLFLSDDDVASVGGGRGSRSWPVDSLPSPADPCLDDPGLHDVPVVAVTGTNGKSTTVRLLAAMVAAQRRQGRALVPGVTSTDWIRVGDEVLDHGDYSGPGGARAVLRDGRVDVALLEAARGGLNRRGLGVPRLDVGVLTNIAADHLGEHGSSSLEDLLDVKWTVARVARHVVLNAEDPLLAARGGETFAPGDGRLTWFALDPEHPGARAHAAAGGRLAILRGESLVLVVDGSEQTVLPVGEVPVTMAGAARHNVANALAAMATAAALDIDLDAIRSGLRAFGTRREDNPGRLDLYRLGDGAEGQALAIVDFAHNAEGLEALLGVAGTLEHRRLLVVLGQAGDREDDAIVELADIAWRHRPDRILLKRLDAYRRGREEGEVPELLRRRLLGLGAAPEDLVETADDMEAARFALEWARPGDLLLLATHSDRQAVLELLQGLERAGWCPGEPLPPRP